MNQIDDGGPAFPVTDENMDAYCSIGISIRDYFAAKAMQAMICTVPPLMDHLWPMQLIT